VLLTEITMNQRYDVLGFGLIVLGCAIFAALGTTDALFTEQSWLYKWQSLLGSLLGAAGTILGSRYMVCDARSLTANNRSSDHKQLPKLPRSWHCHSQSTRPQLS